MSERALRAVDIPQPSERVVLVSIESVGCGKANALRTLARRQTRHRQEEMGHLTSVNLAGKEM